MSKKYYVYVLSSYKEGTLYVGVTNNLKRRVFEHKNKMTSVFTEKYNVKLLVYFEVFDDVIFAIEREKKLKHFSRNRKLRLINEFNPNWDDLYFSL